MAAVGEEAAEGAEEGSRSAVLSTQVLHVGGTPGAGASLLSHCIKHRHWELLGRGKSG